MSYIQLENLNISKILVPRRFLQKIDRIIMYLGEQNIIDLAPPWIEWLLKQNSDVINITSSFIECIPLKLCDWHVFKLVYYFKNEKDEKYTEEYCEDCCNLTCNCVKKIVVPHEFEIVNDTRIFQNDDNIIVIHQPVIDFEGSGYIIKNSKIIKRGENSHNILIIDDKPFFKNILRFHNHQSGVYLNIWFTQKVSSNI